MRVVFLSIVLAGVLPGLATAQSGNASRQGHGASDGSHASEKAADNKKKQGGGQSGTSGTPQNPGKTGQ